MARKASGDACSADMVGVARKQAEELMQEAQRELKKHKKGKYPECDRRLATAKTLMDQARKSHGTALEERNAYIRATFQAGQARICPLIASIEKGQIERRAKKKRKGAKS